MTTRRCQRCGCCCNTVGRTFWKAGDLRFEGPPYFKDCKELNEWSQNGDHEDNDLPCEMLDYEDGKAVCLIEFVYGRKYKPVACKEYPEKGEKCFLKDKPIQAPAATAYGQKGEGHEL